MIAINGWDETKEDVRQFVDKEKLRHPILLMGQETSLKLFNVEGLPTVFFINREGRIVHREMGFDVDMVSEMEHRIEKLLAEREKPSQ